jgi:hypothetical protein
MGFVLFVCDVIILYFNILLHVTFSMFLKIVFLAHSNICTLCQVRPKCLCGKRTNRHGSEEPA